MAQHAGSRAGAGAFGPPGQPAAAREEYECTKRSRVEAEGATDTAQEEVREAYTEAETLRQRTAEHSRRPTP